MDAPLLIAKLFIGVVFPLAGIPQAVKPIVDRTPLIGRVCCWGKRGNRQYRVVADPYATSQTTGRDRFHLLFQDSWRNTYCLLAHSNDHKWLLYRYSKG